MKSKTKVKRIDIYKLFKCNTIKFLKKLLNIFFTTL